MSLSVPIGDVNGPQRSDTSLPHSQMSQMVALASTRRVTQSQMGDTSPASHPACMTLCPHGGHTSPLQPFWVGDRMGGSVVDSV